MNHRHRDVPPSRQTTVRFEGRDYPVLETLRVHRRTYLLLKRLSGSKRERYLAFDPDAGPEGDLRSVLILPRSTATTQHARMLKGTGSAHDPFPLILDYQDQRDRIVVVLKWIHGVDLETYLADVKKGRRPRPGPTEAFRRIHGLAHGISRRHRRQQIVHGDIKPANLILERDSGRLVLIDYGSAWGIERGAGQSEGDGFHAPYAAPERQDPSTFVDFRSDQFALSAILYELITLQLPYDHLGGKAGRPGYIERMKDKLVPPSQLSPEQKRIPRIVWQGIDRVACRGLALRPNDRYPTPAAWLNDLDTVRAQIQQPSPLSPTNDWLTRVVAWIVDRLGRR